MVSVVRKIQQTKIIVLGKLSKKDCFYQMFLFVIRKNQGLLKIKKLIV